MPLSQQTSHYLCIDQGGHASRALLFDDSGKIISHASRDIATLHPQDFFVEHDPAGLINSIKDAVVECLSNIEHAEQLNIIAGIATQRSSLVCWNHKTGQALSNVISWQDTRAAAWLNSLSNHFDAVHAATGLYPSAHHGASKIHWCLQHLDAVQAAHAAGELTIGPLASFIAYQLCNERPLKTDPANGSRTLLLNVKSKCWGENLLNLFNIPGDILPRPTPCQHDYGTIILNQYRLPLKLLTGDQSAAIFHHGLPESQACYINLGTGAFVQRCIEQPPTQPHRLLASLAYSDDNQDYFTLEGTINGAGSAISWFENTIENLPWQEHLDHWLAHFNKPLVFLNTVGGLASPYWQPNLTPTFVGDGNSQEKLCAVVESILFLIQVNLDAMHKLLTPAQKIYISGGLSQSDQLCQHLADLTKTAIHRYQEKEATAKGLYFLLGGDVKSAHLGNEQIFHPKLNTQLDGQYSRWKQEINNYLHENS